MKQRRFLEPEHYAAAPQYPKDRPPTRREVWERQHFLYAQLKPHHETSACDQDCLRPTKNQPDELVSRCRNHFVTIWVSWYRKGWRTQPDWKEGDPVVPSRVPQGPFWPDENWTRKIYDSLERKTR